MEFIHLKTAIAAQFKRMSAHQLFRVKIMGPDENGATVDMTKTKLWDTYLGSFPEGTNPLYRERTEHDCSCCKGFIRAVGDVVAVIDGKLVSLWDVDMKAEPGYQPVVDALAALVKAQPIADVFLHYEGTAGADKTFEQLASGAAQQWNHFHVVIPRQYVMKGADIPSALNGPRSTHQVMSRGLRELRLEDVDLVLELIAQNSLYRGAEHKHALTEFRKLKAQHDALPEAQRDLFVWSNVKTALGSVGSIRNTAIGTLLVDLADGRDLEASVKAFEEKVGAANYKRPTALVTQKMIDQARDKVKELGLETALQRRYATLADVSVSNVLFADRGARKAMADATDAFGGLAPTSVPKLERVLDKIEEVPVERFLAEILPTAQEVEVLFENRHAPNMMSLIAPVDPTAPGLFKWDNGFSWSYAGEFADSIKERVKAAGGNVTGDLCCRLAWEYTDDLDFHMHEPTGDHIYFGTRGRPSRAGGMLDVDANGGSGMMAHPVENIFYAQRRAMKEGTYRLEVNNWSRRSDGVGFTVEIEHDGQVHTFAYEKVLRGSETVQVAEIEYSHKDGFKVNGKLPSTTASRDAWGLKTQDFRRVSAVMLSPNYWDGQGVGNKHYFFMLDGAKNDGTARGFFNEFLKGELDPHRKVLEMVGGKLKISGDGEQLSGLGFSSTQQNTLVVRVKGSFTRTIKVVI
jgi:hypothetical protein